MNTTIAPETGSAKLAGASLSQNTTNLLTALNYLDLARSYFLSSMIETEGEEQSERDWEFMESNWADARKQVESYLLSSIAADNHARQ